MDHYKTTIEGFNKLASAYQEKFMYLDMYNETYDEFCHFLKENASVFEIGCGPGNIAYYLLLKRPDLDILGIDRAPNMIDLAKQNNPYAHFAVMDCRNILSVDQKFDGIICGFCMPYLSKEDCAQLIHDSALLLNPQGVFYFSVIEGDYDRSGFESSSNGEARAYVYYYEEAFLLETIKNAGLEFIKMFRLPYQKGSEIQYHLVFIARIV